MIRAVAVLLSAAGLIACSPPKPSQPDEIASLADLERYVDAIIATGDPPGRAVID